MSNVTPIRPAGSVIERLAEASRIQGELQFEAKLLKLGTIFCLAPDVGMHEFLSALELAGLTFSSVDGVQVIRADRSR